MFFEHVSKRSEYGYRENPLFEKCLQCNSRQSKEFQCKVASMLQLNQRVEQHNFGMYVTRSEIEYNLNASHHNRNSLLIIQLFDSINQQ